jgi:signal peptidase II
VPVIAKVLALTHTHNTGGAFSLFQARNEWFEIVAVVAIVALVFAYHRMKSKSLAVTAALALAFGGAIGNLIDRIRFHEVVDFFDVLVPLPQIGRWPVFNVADSAISIGIVLLAWHFLLSKEHQRQPATHVEPSPEPESTG